MKWIIIAATLLLSVAQVSAVEERTLNNGNLVLQDIPEIPRSIVDDLNRYQNVRSAGLYGWTPDGQSILIATRFGEVS